MLNLKSDTLSGWLVQVFHVPTGRELLSDTSVGRSPAARLLPDASRYISLGENGLAVSPIPLDERSPRELLLLAQVLSSRRIDETNAAVALAPTELAEISRELLRMRSGVP